MAYLGTLPLPAASGASQVLIKATTLSMAAASVTFTNVFSNTYNTYRFVFYNVYPATDAQDFSFQLVNAGGTIATNYQSGINAYPYNSATGTNTNSTSLVAVTGGGQSNVTSNASLCGFLDFFNFSSTNNPCIRGMTSFFISGGTFNLGQVVSTNSSHNTITGMILSYASGNIATGTFLIYGIVES